MTDWMNDLGFKASTGVAGLVGGILSLSYMPELTFKKLMVALVGGIGCAAYLTPIVAELIKLESRSTENGLAFGLGFLGMKLLGGAFKLADDWSKRPTIDLDALKKLGHGDENK